MQIDTRLLRSHPLLSLIPAHTLRRLVTEAALDEYPKGTQVYRAGEPCEAVYLVISGRCQSRFPEGEVEAIHGPGDTPGVRELLNNEPYRTSLTVLTHSVLLRIPSEELVRLFAARPSIAGRFSASVAGRRSYREARRFPWSPRLSRLSGLPDRLAPQAPRRRVRRILSLMALNAGTDPHARALASAVRRVTGGRVLLASFGAEGYGLLRWKQARCDGFNGEFCLERELHRGEDGVALLRMNTRGSEEEARLVPSLLSHLGMHFDFVLLHLDGELPSAVALECLIQSDLCYLFLRPNAADLHQYRLLEERIAAAPNVAIRPIVYLEPSLPRENLIVLPGPGGRPVHAFARDIPQHPGETPSPAFALHLNRLAREIGQCRVGLALSSGGARGLAHIGVIQVLEELGVEVDVVVGSSMGAYVGSIWAHGYNGEAMEAIARELEGRWGHFALLDPVLPPRQGFIRTGRVARRLRRSLGEAHFCDLLRPLRVVATRFETMEEVVFSSGEVVPAVTASIAIPGICVPVVIDGETYIDGGIANPLPVDVLAQSGVEKIIAVNTIPTPEQLRRSVEETGEEPLGWWKRLGRHVNYFARGNILDIMSRSTHGMQMQVAERASRRADVVLHAVGPDARWHDFNHPGKYIALGRTVAEAQRHEILNLVKGEAHDNQPAFHP